MTISPCMVPLESSGGWLGSIHILLVKVQSPALRARCLCGSPGVMAFVMASISAGFMAWVAGSFGLSWAKAGTASRHRATAVNRFFILFPPFTAVIGSGADRRFELRLVTA